MATYVNIINCADDVQNTGVTQCPYKPDVFSGVILVPDGEDDLTKAQVAAISATLNAKIANNNKSLRAFPINFFQGVELKNTEATTRESTFGNVTKLRQGKYGMNWEYEDGGTNMQKQLYSFDGKAGSYKAYLIDAKNNGLAVVSKDGVTVRGFTLDQINVPNIMFATGAEALLLHFELTFKNSDEFNKYLSFIPFPDDADVQDLAGLTPIDMVVDTELAATTAGTLNLKFISGGIDLYDNYSGAIDTASLYTFTNAQTGEAITVTSVTAVPATKSFAVLLDVLDADYPAVGGRVKAYFGDVSDIATAGMVGFGEAIAYSTRIA